MNLLIEMYTHSLTDKDLIIIDDHAILCGTRFTVISLSALKHRFQSSLFSIYLSIVLEIVLGSNKVHVSQKNLSHLFSY